MKKAAALLIVAAASMVMAGCNKSDTATTPAPSSSVASTTTASAGGSPAGTRAGGGPASSAGGRSTESTTAPSGSSGGAAGGQLDASQCVDLTGAALDLQVASSADETRQAASVFEQFDPPSEVKEAVDHFVSTGGAQFDDPNYEKYQAAIKDWVDTVCPS